MISADQSERVQLAYFSRLHDVVFTSSKVDRRLANILADDSVERRHGEEKAPSSSAAAVITTIESRRRAPSLQILLRLHSEIDGRDKTSRQPS